MNIKMVPIEIIGMKEDIRSILTVIRQLGCIHVDDIANAPYVTARTYVPDHELVQHQEKINLTLARVEGLMESLGCSTNTGTGQAAVTDLEEILSELEMILPGVHQAISRREELRAELETLPLYEATLKKLLPILPSEAYVSGNCAIGVFSSREHIAVLDQIGNEVIQFTSGAAQVHAADLDRNTRAMLIVIPASYGKDIENILDEADVTRMRMPGEVAFWMPDRAIENIHKRLQVIKEEISQLNETLHQTGTQWCPKLTAWRLFLRNHLEFYSILPYLGETELTFILTGWVPETDFPRVEQELKLAIGNRVLVRVVPETVELRKNAPVALKNPPMSRPFESLVKLLSIPKYGRIDPTVMMSFFMPIFFGMMLGDIGYGLVILFICLGLHRIVKKGLMRDLLTILTMGAGWAILFGVLFGEFFGSLGEKLGLHAVWYERGSSEHISGFLVMTIIIGAVQVLLGLILGVWESFRSKSKHLLLDRGGKLISLIGLFLLVSVLVDLLPDGLLTPAIAGLIVGIVLLGSSMGWLGLLMGPIEFISLIGNILSYLRIAAIGLASIYLAKVANDVVGIVGNILVGLIVALLIHALNLILGAFSPTIHSLRLHYVEFFQKFFEGGGRPYQPYQNRSE